MKTGFKKAAGAAASQRQKKTFKLYKYDKTKQEPGGFKISATPNHLSI